MVSRRRDTIEWERGTKAPRYVFRGPARGPLASGPGMTVSPGRGHDSAVAFVSS
jgi:hypothetical protein